MERTWDGQPIAEEPPFGASVVVYRRRAGALEFLVLHRAHGGRAEGDWAWGPPAGARHPGEAVGDCAVRELAEESGLGLSICPAGFGGPEWCVYAAEAPEDAPVRLSDEHDAFLWLPAREAAARCLPAFVGESVAAVAASLAGGEAGPRGGAL